MNWGELKLAASQYLENFETTFVANLPMLARLAEEDIYRKVQLPMAKSNVTTTCTAGSPMLALPLDMISIYSLSLGAGTYEFLLPKDEAFLREAFPNVLTTGTPRYYAIRDDINLYLAPTPATALKLEMRYFKKPVSISNGNNNANTNWLSKNGENALLFGLVMHGYIYEKGDQDVIQMYAKQFETAVTDLKLIVEGRHKKDTYRSPDQRMPT